MRICTKCGYTGYTKFCKNREHGLMKRYKEPENINHTCGTGLLL